MVNSSKRSGLGKALQRAQKTNTRKRNPRTSKLHCTDPNPSQDNARLNLKSVTAQTNLDEFFQEAELAGKQFITERRNIKVIDEIGDTPIDLYSTDEKQDPITIEHDEMVNSLSIPRRPKWDSDTSPEQLDEMERLSFLEWRRKLARVQESELVLMTPFEKNLEVWRQLWRVIERSDIVVQILDSRNPLLYLCQDLIKYVESHGSKLNLILMNKADYLTYEQRKIWAKYFRSLNIKTIFFSALFENEKLKTKDGEDVHSDEYSSTQGVETDSDESSTDSAEEMIHKLSIDDNPDDARIYNKFELLDAWRDVLMETKRFDKKTSDEQENLAHDDTMTIGLVGYPNVGKSSTINALLSAKRVAVSATPGKTKHFQTFLVDKDMTLCDCPGLVFPNFVSNKSEMVINGVLPIDQMKDYLGPVRIIVERIPRAYFEHLYGLAFEIDQRQNLIAEDLLNAFGFMRGYMTARGLPDISRAARKVCKDYINGKILYCEGPPDCDKKYYASLSKLAEKIKELQEIAVDSSTRLKITDRQKRLMAQAKGTAITAKEFDESFFQSKTNGFYIKSLPGIGNQMAPHLQRPSQDSRGEKKFKKKEKLRRVFRHLDI